MIRIDWQLFDMIRGKTTILNELTYKEVKQKDTGAFFHDFKAIEVPTRLIYNHIK